MSSARIAHCRIAVCLDQLLSNVSHVITTRSAQMDSCVLLIRLVSNAWTHKIAFHLCHIVLHHPNGVLNAMAKIRPVAKRTSWVGQSAPSSANVWQRVRLILTA